MKRVIFTHYVIITRLYSSQLSNLQPTGRIYLAHILLHSEENTFMETILITVDDYQRILSRMNFVPFSSKLSAIEAALYKTLQKATTLSQQNIPKRVITMNSRVRLLSLLTKKEFEITITYPENSNNLERRISIFSPIGVALLGRKIGDQVSWEIPTGTGQFQIIGIPYQPEAVGEYSL